MDKTISGNGENFRFGKAEKLLSKKLIDLLFREGKSIKINCVRCLYLLTDEQLSSPVQVMISVPKRLFKKAVDRNLIKRRIREAYRLNKNSLLSLTNKKNSQLILAFLFIHTEAEEYHLIEDAIQKIISELKQIMAKM